MIEKIGKLPVNSRITIDYTKTPPSIDFGYPDPDTSVVRRSDVTYFISMIFAGIIFLILFSSYTNWVQPIYYPHISDAETTIDNVAISRFEYFNGTNYIHNGSYYGFSKLLINYTWNDKPHFTTIYLSEAGPLFPMPYFQDTQNSSTTQMLGMLLQAFILIIIFFILTIANSYWVGKVFRDTKWGNKKFPEFNKRIHNAYYSVEFTRENFPANNIIEIPLFKNMYMDYDATGDFAEQLKKITIIEHPFNKLIRKGKGKRKQIIKKRQVNLWKCIFEFKGKPKDGGIEIRFT